MKKSLITLCTLVSGIFLVVIFLVGGAGDIADPSEIPGVLYSDLISNVIAVGLGFFLIYRYFQRKKEETTYSNVVDNSPEENEYFKAKQNRIFGYLMLFTIWGSVEVWILNNYQAGFTLTNVYIIADLLTSLILFFLSIQLLRNRDFAKLFVVVYLINILAAATFSGFKSEWIDLLSSLLLGAYPIFAISKPITKSHYKLANYIVLPALFVVMLFITSFDIRTDKLWEDLNEAEQKSININSETATAYQNFATDDLPTKEDIDELTARLSRGAQQQREVISVLNLLKDEYSKQLTSESQILSIKIIDLNTQYYNVMLEENTEIKEFAEYALELNFNNLTDEQRSKLSEYRIAVENYTSKFNDIGFEIDKAQKDLDE